MKKATIAAMTAMMAMLSLNPIRTSATASELKKIRCTCYCEDGITYSGHKTHMGVIAGRREDIGDVAALYAINSDGSLGDFIGYFDFYDIGAGIDTDGDGIGDSIKKGKSVDVFRNNLTDVKEFIKTYGDYVYIKIIEAEG